MLTGRFFRALGAFGRFVGVTLPQAILQLAIGIIRLAAHAGAIIVGVGAGWFWWRLMDGARDMGAGDPLSDLCYFGLPVWFPRALEIGFCVAVGAGVWHGLQRGASRLFREGDLRGRGNGLQRRTW